MPKEFEFPEKGVYPDGSGKTVTIEKPKETKSLPDYVDVMFMYGMGAKLKGAGAAETE